MLKEDLLEEMAKTLPFEKQKIFLLLLLERAFCCYKKHSKGKRWDCIEHLNQIIEDCWDYMINGTEYDYIMATKELYVDDDVTDDWEDELYKHSPSNIIVGYEEYNQFDFLGKNIVVLSEIVKRVYITFAWMVEEASSRPTFSSAVYGANLFIIETFIREYYDELDGKKHEEIRAFMEQHPLIILEFEREKRDIEYLKQEDDLKKIYQKYRFEMNESLLEDYWFEEEYL